MWSDARIARGYRWPDETPLRQGAHAWLSSPPDGTSGPSTARGEGPGLGCGAGAEDAATGGTPKGRALAAPTVIPPLLRDDCVAAWLPPTSAAHGDVVRMRGWLNAAAGGRCRIVYRPEALPDEPLRHRLAVSFAHVCRLLRVPAAVEVDAGPVPDVLAAVLERWPEVGIAARAPDPDTAARAVLNWGPRLALLLVPTIWARQAAAGWDGTGWIVTAPATPG